MNSVGLFVFTTALDVTEERIYFYNNNDNAVESVTFAGEHFRKVVTQGQHFDVMPVSTLSPIVLQSRIKASAGPGAVPKCGPLTDL